MAALSMGDASLLQASPLWSPGGLRRVEFNAKLS